MLENYEIAVLVQMYDTQIIGERGYISLQKTRIRIKWAKIASHYKIKKSFKMVAKKLVKKGYLSDHGKSMAVLSLEKLGVTFAFGYLQLYPEYKNELNSILVENG